jgi:hypothetical protein
MGLKALLFGEGSYKQSDDPLTTHDVFEQLMADTLGPEYVEERKIQRMKGAIKLAKDRSNLLEEIVSIARDDPEFAHQLQIVLNRLQM